MGWVVTVSIIFSFTRFLLLLPLSCLVVSSLYFLLSRPTLLFVVLDCLLTSVSITDADPAPLLPDSSVADPASVGIAMLLANWTNLDSNDDQYERAARNQYNYLFSDSVPKTGQGAISHRLEEAQLWYAIVFSDVLGRLAYRRTRFDTGPTRSS